MKINIVILDSDQIYLNRLLSHLQTKYSSKLEIYSFTKLDLALAKVQEAKVDVFLADNGFDIDVESLPNRCGFAYLVSSSEVETYRDQVAVSKFQKLDLFYRQILSIYSEKAGTVTGLKFTDEACQIIAFATPAGGVGSSTMAAACARHFAARGGKTLYLNLEQFGSADSFFDADGQFGMSDIIFSLKSQKANLAMKLESAVKFDEETGVYFYSESKLALDMREIHIPELVHLLSVIQLTQSYSYVILDMDFALSPEHLPLFRMLHAFISVSDGSEIANYKIERAFEAMEALEQDEDFPLYKRMAILYNKFSNKTGESLDLECRVLGGAPRYEHAHVSQILDRLDKLDVFQAALNSPSTTPQA